RRRGCPGRAPSWPTLAANQAERALVPVGLGRIAVAPRAPDRDLVQDVPARPVEQPPQPGRGEDPPVGRAVVGFGRVYTVGDRSPVETHRSVGGDARDPRG